MNLRGRSKADPELKGNPCPCLGPSQKLTLQMRQKAAQYLHLVLNNKQLGSPPARLRPLAKLHYSEGARS